MPRAHFVAHDVSASSPAQPRIAAWMRELARRGWETKLWTAIPPGPWTGASNLHVREVPDPVLRLYRRVQPDSATPKTDAASRPSWLQRVGRAVQERLLFPDNESIWSGRVRRRVLAELRTGDVVVTCSRPESVGSVGAAARRRGAAWWFDFADGWCFQGLRAQATREGPRRERELALEREQVRQADVVSTVHAELARYFAALRGADDVLVYPNVIPDELAELSEVAAAAGTPRLCYFGRLSLSDPGRSLQPLLELLARAPHRPVRFRFRGEYGARDRAELAALVAAGYEVEILPPVPRIELLRDRETCDAALFVSSPGQLGTSSKLLDLLGMRLPTFALTEPTSAATSIVTATGCGECAPLDDADAATERWQSFLAGLAAGRYRCIPDRLLPYRSSHHVPELCDRLAELAGRPAADRDRDAAS